MKTRTAEQKQLPTKNKSNLTCKNSTKNSHISLTQYIINNHSKITKGQETNTNTILTTNLQSVNVTNHALIPLGSGCNPESNIAFICYFSLIIFDQGYFFSHSFFFFFDRAACRILVPQLGTKPSNPCLLQRKNGALTTRPPAIPSVFHPA